MNTSTLSTRLKVLCFVDYYLPGYKAGGPIRSIDNLVTQLKNELEFWIVARDRDFSDVVPYSSIIVNKWNKVGNANVFFAGPEMLTFFGLMRIMQETPHDILYLNSYFSPKTTILPLFIRRIGLYGDKPVILAPRGEFSAGALAIKESKKKIYLYLASLIGLYSQVIWQASSEFEMEDIRGVLPSADILLNVKNVRKIIIAPDLVGIKSQTNEDNQLDEFDASQRGPLRIVFLSRISPKKNLDYLLRALRGVNLATVFSIYGPIEDSIYWSECQSLIRNLPSHISVKYHGQVNYEQVPQVFSAHDVFVFPTRGENFGHVIYESLNAGTPVIVSDQTPWQSDPEGALVVLSLDQPDVWTAAICQWASFNDEVHTIRRAAAVGYASNYDQTNQALQQNRSLFLNALSCSKA